MKIGSLLVRTLREGMEEELKRTYLNKGAGGKKRFEKILIDIRLKVKKLGFLDSVN